MLDGTECREVQVLKNVHDFSMIFPVLLFKFHKDESMISICMSGTNLCGVQKSISGQTDEIMLTCGPVLLCYLRI